MNNEVFVIMFESVPYCVLKGTEIQVRKKFLDLKNKAEFKGDMETYCWRLVRSNFYDLTK